MCSLFGHFKNFSQHDLVVLVSTQEEKYFAEIAHFSKFVSHLLQICINVRVCDRTVKWGKNLEGYFRSAKDTRS